MGKFQEEVIKSEKNLSVFLNTKVNSLKMALNELKTLNLKETKTLADDIGKLRESIKEVSGVQASVFENKFQKLESKIDILSLKEPKDFTERMETLEDDFRKLKSRTISTAVGGGNANRNIAVGGNSSVLSRYTDINLIAGSGTSLSYSNNDNTKQLDLTITAAAGLGTSETPTGAITGTDGTDGNAVFTLSQIPISGTLNLYVSGLWQDEGASQDYTLSGVTITFNSGAIPIIGQKIRATYRY